MLLSVVGPGIITGTVDNDATGITGYALAGSQFGYDLLWLLIVTAICLAAIQEMVARMGTVTGKGLYDVDAFEAALADRVPYATHLSLDGVLSLCRHLNCVGVTSTTRKKGVPKVLRITTAGGEA